MICTWYFKIVSNFTRLTAREITYNNFKISLVVFMPNITTNNAITCTNLANLTFLCGKKPVWNKMVTFFKCNSVEHAIARPNDCLLFTWANRFVHGLGRWISSRNRTHEFHLPKNRCERVKLVSKMGLKKWNTDFLLEYYDWENWTTLTFRTLCSFQEFFHRQDPKSRVSFTFHTDF